MQQTIGCYRRFTRQANPRAPERCYGISPVNEKSGKSASELGTHFHNNRGVHKYIYTKKRETRLVDFLRASFHHDIYCMHVLKI